jgi:hypothetical protein
MEWVSNTGRAISAKTVGGARNQVQVGTSVGLCLLESWSLVKFPARNFVDFQMCESSESNTNSRIMSLVHPSKQRVDVFNGGARMLGRGPSHLKFDPYHNYIKEENRK